MNIVCSLCGGRSSTMLCPLLEHLRRWKMVVTLQASNVAGKSQPLAIENWECHLENWGTCHYINHGHARLPEGSHPEINHAVGLLEALAAGVSWGCCSWWWDKTGVFRWGAGVKRSIQLGPGRDMNDIDWYRDIMRIAWDIYIYTTNTLTYIQWLKIGGYLKLAMSMRTMMSHVIGSSKLQEPMLSDQNGDMLVS